ncbi:MAG: transposase, partial [bacterium]
MPRANRHIQPGNTYHVTHRCHDRAFLLRFARDRQAYRAWLRDGLAHWSVNLLTYCITSNHVHLLLKASTPHELARFMQRVAGGMAQAYNQRKRRSGAFWSDRYHAAMIEDGEHLWRCMQYIDLNMVRAGQVAHPSDWEWTGWGELMGERRRNKILSMDTVLYALDVATETAFRKLHAERIADALARRSFDREPWWTESVAVGSAEFTGRIEQELTVDYTRRRL